MQTLAKPARWSPGFNREHPLARGLVGYWPFWEGQGDKVYDKANPFAIGNHGTLTNGPTWLGSPYGWALDFDGDDDHILVSDSPGFAFAGPFTLLALAKPDATDAAGALIYQYDLSSKDGYYLMQHTTGSGVWLFTTFVNPSYVQCSSDNPPNGDWQHICGTRDAAGLCTLYVDGKPQADTETLAGAIDSSDPVYIGKDRGAGKEFAGKIALISAWDRALTPVEIRQLYADPFALVIPRRRIFPAAAAGPAVDELMAGMQPTYQPINEPPLVAVPY